MMQRIRTFAIPLLVLVLIAIVPQVLGSFHIALLNDIGIAALVVIGLILVSGIGGALSFGKAAFVGIAAYTTAWPSTPPGLSPWAGLALGLLLTGRSQSEELRVGKEGGSTG